MPTEFHSQAVQDWPKMPRAVNQATALLQTQYGDEGIPGKQLKREAERIGGYKKGSVILSDYCYNLINKATYSFRYPILERVGLATYKYLGTGFKYTGRVMWNPEDGDEEQVGSWRAGVCTLEKDPRKPLERDLLSPSEQHDSDAGEISVAEGRELLRRHRVRERSPRLVTKKKRDVLAKTGRLECEVCRFDFAAVCGPLGDGFAECHHTQPLLHRRPANAAPSSATWE